jgi:alpha-tubulin suppressor-like RCC1 family protein/5-hydroxyisourate hydrolase-like protein (transthyretin family)
MIRAVATRRLFPLLGLIAPLLAGCGGESTQPLRAVALAVVTQPSASARSGVALDQAPVVELRDRNGAPFAEAGVPVAAAVSDGAGLTGTTTISTDANGRATFSGLSISGAVGSRTLTFTSSGLTAVSAQPIALAAGLAAQIQANGSTSVQGTVNTAVGTLPAVVVKDASGNPVSGVAVTFAIPTGAGSLTGATATTNASGIATVGSWTLPKTSGQYTLTATATGVPGNGVTFTATGTPDAPSVMQPANSGQSALYGALLPTALEVHLLDQYGNPTPGVSVTWTPVAGGGTASAVNAATDASGIARANYRLGLVPGTNRVQASVAAPGLTTELTASALGFTQFAVGGDHVCALDENGAAFCWGKDDSGQLGINSTANRSSPVAVTGGLHFRRITAGFNVTCALTADNTPYCWGSNSFAALGDGTLIYHLVPTPVSGGFHFTEISTGGQTTCALDASGAAYCWGENGITGKLGLGSTPAPDTCPSVNGDLSCSKVPLAVSGGLVFTSISTSGGHSCALTANGDVYCWGTSYNFGGPGGGTDPSPVLVSNGLAFASVTASDGHVCGLVAPSSAYCWGQQSQWGAIGNGFTNQTEVKPVLLQNFAVQQVEARGLGSCALTTDNHGYCWGFNNYGAVGDGTLALRTTPTPVNTSLLFTAIHTSGYAACGLTPSGQLYCWGDNTWGELGAGDVGAQLTPTLVKP